MKIKAVCDIFGKNTVWNLLVIHGWFWTVLGWLYFFTGNEHYLKSAWLAGGATMFLFAVHIYKKIMDKI